MQQVETGRVGDERLSPIEDTPTLDQIRAAQRSCGQGAKIDERIMRIARAVIQPSD